jgi:hypothetical protein
MHTAQRSLPAVVRYVALRHLGIQTVLLKLPLTPGTGKETALIGLELQMNLNNSGQFSLIENHRC